MAGGQDAGRRGDGFIAIQVDRRSHLFGQLQWLPAAGALRGLVGRCPARAQEAGKLEPRRADRRERRRPRAEPLRGAAVLVYASGRRSCGGSCRRRGGCLAEGEAGCGWGAGSGRGGSGCQGCMRSGAEAEGGGRRWGGRARRRAKGERGCGWGVSGSYCAAGPKRGEGVGRGAGRPGGMLIGCCAGSRFGCWLCSRCARRTS